MPKRLTLGQVLLVIVVVYACASIKTAYGSASRSLLEVSASCAIQIGGKNAVYDACATAPGVNFTTYWTTATPLLGASTVTIDMAFQAGTPGWAGVAFPTTPGQMVGSSAVIAQLSAVASGSSADGYFLSAQSAAGVQPPPQIPITITATEAVPGGVGVKAAFTAQLPTSYIESGVSSVLIALGPLTSDGGLAYHTQRLSKTLNLTSSGNTTPVVVDSGIPLYSKGTAHAWLMTIGFGVLMPIGMLAAIGMKSYGPPMEMDMEGTPNQRRKWCFDAHRLIMALSYCLVVAGLGLGISRSGVWNTKYPVSVHGGIGMTAFVLASVQILIGIGRPALDSKYRPSFNVIHSNLGRAALILAIVNIYYGIIEVSKLAVWTYAVYSAVLGVLLSAAAVVLYIRALRGGSEEQVPKGAVHE